jgi:catechol 2,3-dioxygenase-like lactoylglutathione lyase family enzyme
VTILRIERVVYAVDDISTCVRFFEDFGLLAESVSDAKAELRTLANQVLELRRTDDPELPAGLEAGSTVREVVWGVDSQASLDALIADLRSDRPVTVDENGIAHTLDETGYGLGLAVADPAELSATAFSANAYGNVQRWNQGLAAPEKVRPLRICHIALNIPKEGREKANDFYLDRLNFRATDKVLQMGTFMQCEGDDDQHNLLLCHRPDRAGINHTSYEVRSFDEVIVGGNQMIEAGWQEARRLGRHTVGSNVFRFFHAPCGGRVEYAADMDRVDASYETRVHEVTPPHHLWTLRTNREGASS